MNNRKRKKWLKKNKKYVPITDIYDLDINFSNYIYPRLVLFREKTTSYPFSCGSLEGWHEILDKMILAFEYINDCDNWWIDNPLYDYIEESTFSTEKTEDGCYRLKIDKTEKGKEIENAHNAEEQKRNAVIKEGLALFAEHFRDLWW